MDVKTLLFSNMLVCAFFVIAFFIYSSEQKTFRGFKLWTLGALLMTLGFLSLTLRGLNLAGLSIFLMNGLFSLAAVTRLDAIYRFLGKQRLNKCVYLIPFSVGLGCLYFYLVDDQIFIRSIISTTTFSILSFLLSWSLIRHSPPENTSLYYSAAAIITIRSLTILGRAWVGHFSDWQQIFDDSGWSSFQLGLGLICEISQNVFFLMMNSKRAEANFIRAQSKLNATVFDLKKALSEVRKLQGILPICAHCKKIRDDQGAWQGLEEYVRDRSDAEFSHGICPECATAYFPDVDFTRLDNQ